MPKRLTYKDVKQYFEDHDCELFEKEYINSYTSMRYKCDCGNEDCKITFTRFKNGGRCKKCGIKKCQEKQKLIFKDVKKYFEDHDCELLETEYINANTPMKYECNCENSSKITFGNFRRGSRCNKCSTLKVTHTFEYVKQYFEDYDCELLEKEYINSQTKIRYRCSCKNIEMIKFNGFCNKKHKCCSECLLKRRREGKRFGKDHWNWIEDREELKERNRFKSKCRSMLRSVLKRIGKPKDNKTFLMLGYNSEQLRKHVYSHPNWEKVRNKEWHLDHIHPIKAFLDYGIRDIKLINCFENLQPLTKEDNLKKGAKYDEKEFEEWLVGKGYEIICE